jgi:chemotaxis signal transduction protein
MFRDGVARLLVFRLGSERFALELAAVDEVIEVPAVQRVPDAPANVLGLATIRGELVSVYDPRPTLRVGDRVDGAALVFAREDRRMALAIDDVFDPIVVEASELRPAPGMESSDGVLVGVVLRDGRLIAVLDADALVNAATLVTEGDHK